MAPNSTTPTTSNSPFSPALKLLDLTLKPSTSIISSTIGEFTKPSSYEIAMLRGGGIIELYSIETTTAPSDDDDGSDEEEPRTSLKLITRMETRSVLRCAVAMRLSGEKRDILAVGADGGCCSILDFEGGKGVVLHCPSFGKTGCRRGTPGQYLAADPKGRALMISSIEKRKFVYVLNRDAQGRPTIASPLEAHRNRSLTFATCGVDNGYDNPIFAALELQYPEHVSLAEPAADAAADDDSSSPQKNPIDAVAKELAYYELDLGLNHVSRRWATPVHRTACCLCPIPGGSDGPGGVLVGGDDWIEYLHENSSQSLATGGGKIAAAVPRRALHPKDKPVLIQSVTVFRQKRNKFFGLAQTELGDVYKITLVFDEEMGVSDMVVSLLDTLPVGNSLNITKTGMLFVASEFGDHFLYQFERIDLEDAVTTSSSAAHKALMASQDDEEEMSPEMLYTTERAVELAVEFTPTRLKNLRIIYSMESLAPTTGVLVGELAGGEVSPQIYALCGRGGDSTLRILRHGAAVTELAVSDLPGTPGAVFTVSSSTPPLHSKYIIVSFADATLILSVGDTVEEVTENSGFLTNAPTLACAALADDRGGICQVHPGGVRHIQRGIAKQWHCPGLKRVETASANESQVLIAFAGGEIIYFELDPMSGNLTECETRDMGADVCCLDVGSVGRGRTRSFFAAVGCLDHSVRIVSLAPESLLVQRSSTALRARPHGVCLQRSEDEGEEGEGDVILSVGLEDGSALRCQIDSVTGQIASNPTRRFLGARPVSTLRAQVDNQSCTLLLSSRPWISHPDPTSPQKHLTTPLSYAPLDHACRFSSAAVREGIVATAGTTLRILALEGFQQRSDSFNSVSVKLRYTPRQMCLLGQSQMVIVEADAREYNEEEKKKMGFDASGGADKKTAKKEEEDTMDVDSDDEDEEKAKKEEEKKDDKTKDNDDDDDEEEDPEDAKQRSTPIRGPVPSLPGVWGSCIRLLDPTDSCQTLDLIELSKNEAALCCTSVRFHSRGNEPLLAVGTATALTMHPLHCTEAHIVLYRVVNGDRLQLLHRTKVEAPVLSLVHFRGRLLVGVGGTVRLYEMGKRQLLRKCELRSLPTIVKTLQAAGDRAYVGDVMQSVHILRYDAGQNRLILVANDRVTSRAVTCQELLDLDTIAVGDKFGNVAVLRLPRGADVTVVDVSGTRALWESGRDDATPKLQTLCHYHVGEVVTGMTRASLVAGGSDALIYVTVTGRIGALVPMTSRDDVEFYRALEGSLRKLAPRPTGREPQAYRSYYAPVKHVVDGDLCESFVGLDGETRGRVAEEVERSVGEIMKKLEDTRNALL